jgi:hypothetical protein
MGRTSKIIIKEELEDLKSITNHDVLVNNFKAQFNS